MTTATTQDLRRRVTAAVDLGPTADAIADRLRAKGIKGQHENSLGCPLARAILAAIPEAQRVIVGGSVVLIRAGGLHVEVELPAAAREFVRRFDEGLYLGLVAPAVMP